VRIRENINMGGSKEVLEFWKDLFDRAPRPLPGACSHLEQGCVVWVGFVLTDAKSATIRATIRDLAIRSD
jgi:hypothetical protein